MQSFSWDLHARLVRAFYMEACPDCGNAHIGLDVIYTEGAAAFCQACMVRGPRVPVSVATLYADQMARANQAWDEWAQAKQLQKLTLPEGGYINDTRLSG
jgi:hypothetical protein